MNDVSITLLPNRPPDLVFTVGSARIDDDTPAISTVYSGAKIEALLEVLGERVTNLTAADVGGVTPGGAAATAAILADAARDAAVLTSRSEMEATAAEIRTEISQIPTGGGGGLTADLSDPLSVTLTIEDGSAVVADLSDPLSVTLTI